VLIVLDQAYYFFALFNIMKYRHSLSEGSVLIITSEAPFLPSEWEIETVFRVELMDTNESLELLSWHAFREAKPIQEYDGLAKEVVDYCGGLPLALELIGSSLFERTKEEWQGVIFELKKTHMYDVQKKFEVIFHALLNEMEKNLFLDVCCFFVGKGRGYVTKILNGCGVNADIGIRVLMERNLIKIKKNNKLGMHPLLQQMGITIIREISVKEPGKNRRLWFDKDKKYVRTLFIYRLKLLSKIFAFSCAIHWFFFALFITGNTKHAAVVRGRFLQKSTTDRKFSVPS